MDWGTDGNGAKSGEMTARIKIDGCGHVGTRMIQRSGSSPAPLPHQPALVCIATCVVEKARNRGKEAAKCMRATDFRMDMSERLVHASVHSSWPQSVPTLRYFLLPPEPGKTPIPERYFGIAPTRPVDDMAQLYQILTRGEEGRDTLLLFAHRAFFFLGWYDATILMSKMSENSMLGVGYR